MAKKGKKTYDTNKTDKAKQSWATRPKAPMVTLAANKTQPLDYQHESGKAFTSQDYSVLAEKVREFACKQHRDTLHIFIEGDQVGMVRWSRTKISGGFEARFSADVRTKKVKLVESVITFGAILDDHSCVAREQSHEDKGKFVVIAECRNKATTERVFAEITSSLLRLAMFDDRAAVAAAIGPTLMADA